MAQRLLLADIKFIADFAAFCRMKGDERYDYCDARVCALAQFMAATGARYSGARPCGIFLSDSGNWWPRYDTALHFALNAGGEEAAFSALADRLEALLVDAPEIVR